MNIYIYNIYIYIYVCLYVCVYVERGRHINMYGDIHIHTWYIYTYIYVHIYTYLCVHVFPNEDQNED